MGLSDYVKMPDDGSSFVQGVIIGIILLTIIIFASTTIMNLFAGYGITLDIHNLICGK